VTDYRGDYRVGRNKLPQGALSLRDALLHEGAAALTRSQPRPDMRQNGFCTGCHIPAAQDTLRPLGLIRTALTAGEQRTPLDPRTQPLQPPSLYGLRAVVRGHVPAGFTSGANGAQPKQGQVDPFALDLLLPP